MCVFFYILVHFLRSYCGFTIFFITFFLFFLYFNKRKLIFFSINKNTQKLGFYKMMKCLLVMNYNIDYCYCYSCAFFAILKTGETEKNFTYDLKLPKEYSFTLFHFLHLFFSTTQVFLLSFLFWFFHCNKNH